MRTIKVLQELCAARKCLSGHQHFANFTRKMINCQVLEFISISHTNTLKEVAV